MSRILTAAALLMLLGGCGGVGEEAEEIEEPLAVQMSLMTTGLDMPPEGEGPQSLFSGRCSVPSDWVIRFEFSGESPTLGAIRGTAGHCSQVTAWRTAGEEMAPDSVTYGDGQFAFVTAAGDTLRGTYDQGTGGTSPDGTMWFRDQLTITGGTGRFVGATGEGEESGRFVGLDQPFSMEVRATLRYGGAARTGA